MNVRMFLAVACLLGVLTGSGVAADKAADKAALQALNDFIGSWKGDASSKDGTKDVTWKETVEWGWKIKGDDLALGLKFTGSKQFSEGVLRYLADKKKYQLTATPAGETAGGKADQVFTGEIKAKKLVLERVDAATKDKYTIEMSTNNDGARFVYNVALQKKSFGVAKKVVEAGLTKEGVSLAGGKKNECIVTGGAGTMAVSFNGKTYYVCCSGCRDEFNANPKKYVDEYEKANKK
ncbi:YHS domain-containing protein [Zavarzinella formosa]|uniref:YHS domain-containing protein n=1 Tax=Zavarzinella formosa TaxID=360055 RepID=UPI0003000059|nr:YHS domain-containing protein [Zavarzinella formosa]